MALRNLEIEKIDLEREREGERERGGERIKYD
jgi:hypothetical protein